MRGPSLQKTAIVSFTLHVTAFLIVFLVLKQSNQIIMPSPYTVSLVSPNVPSGAENRRPEEPSVHKTKGVPIEPQSDVTGKITKEKAREKEMSLSGKKQSAKQKIDELRRKREALANIERRRPVIPLKGGKAGQSTGMKTASYGGRGKSFDDYYSMITKQIRQQWAFPEIGRKDMEAIVSVRILKDGTAIVQKIEKSSGNALFDRSAVKALAKASPLSPPPYEMEIGVRFFP